MGRSHTITAKPRKYINGDPGFTGNLGIKTTTAKAGHCVSSL
jgi:hypothetical protein